MLGLAFSGGGITGIIGSICALNSILSVFPSINLTQVSYATSSGGTLGVGIHGTVLITMGQPLRSECWIQYLGPSIRCQHELSNCLQTDHQHHQVPAKPLSSHFGRPIWYGAVINYLPAQLGVPAQLGARQSNTSGWWTKVIDLMFWEGYSVHDYDITSGTVRWHPNFGVLTDHIFGLYLFQVLAQSECPITRNRTTGVMKHAQTALTVATVDMGTLTVHTPSNLTLDAKLSLLQVMGYSSSFWAAAIVESKVMPRRDPLHRAPDQV